MRNNRAAIFCATLLALLMACGGDDEPDAEISGAGDGDAAVVAEDEAETVDTGLGGEDEMVETPHFLESLPPEFANLWNPWFGDFDGIVERRGLRVLVPFGGYQYYFVNGQPRGAIIELLQKLEKHINESLGRRHVRIYVVPIPVARDQLIPYLLEGHADLIAADLTVTDMRSQELRFSRPLLKNVSEVIVMGPSAPSVSSIDDLAGQEIYVRESSSYFEHLLTMAEDFERRGLEPPVIRPADELLEAEDIMEMLDAGMIQMSVMDDYKAEFWTTVFPNVRVRKDLVVNEGGVIAWAMPQDSSQLADVIEGFLRKYGRGTLVGNDTFNRYLESAERVRCAMAPQVDAPNEELARWMQLYGDEYGFDWLMLAAQGYRESRLNQSKKSPVGALGVMQIKPSTAADRNVNIPDITILENNIHAGAKYMRFLADRYFSDDMDDLNRWFFSLAAYNAGPAKVARLRREAEADGLDPDRWFNNVEIIAARRIGRETVTYVANIYKYYVGYKMAASRIQEQAERHGVELTGCSEQVAVGKRKGPQLRAFTL